MLIGNNTALEIKCQQYECKTYMRDLEGKRSVFMFESTRNTEEVHCPYCDGKVYICDYTSTHLRDMPIWQGISQDLTFLKHIYRCTECGRKHTEGVPFTYPGTRITERAASWVQGLLQQKIPIKTIQRISGIHWDVIRKIHIQMMESTLTRHWDELIAGGYRPRYLAVDEFAIHKGHTYATCVMDIDSGEVIWVGKGRSKEDFSAFFDSIPPFILADVQAVAMDMNASYHILVKENMPQAEIVYDRYHMQAQFGKEVLGVVRLEEARKHKLRAENLKTELEAGNTDKKRELKESIREEKQQYSIVKKLRWSLLANGANLREEDAVNLKSVLDSHYDLAVCYAMKEEMSNLFQLEDEQAAETGWRKWFAAAKESGIPALVHFAELKLPRLDGLIAHARHRISTAKLEGFNNKIKVAKRVGYGYRNDDYFFMLVRMLSLSPGKS